MLSLPIDCNFCSSQPPSAFTMKELPIHAGKFAANIEFCLGPKIYLSRVVLTDDSRKSRVSCHDNSYMLCLQLSFVQVSNFTNLFPTVI